MERLVAVGFNINKRNKENYTALHFGKFDLLFWDSNIYHMYRVLLGLSMLCSDVRHSKIKGDKKIQKYLGTLKKKIQRNYTFLKK